MESLAIIVGAGALLFSAAGFCLGFSLGEIRAKRWYERHLMTDLHDMQWYWNQSELQRKPSEFGKLTLIEGGLSRKKKWFKDGEGT